jgi:primosomal protein N''
MDQFGYTEQEARVSIYLDEAEKLLTELERQDQPGKSVGHIVWREMHVREHFNALRRQLALRVLRRDYPEGWGYRRSKDEEEQSHG